MKLELSIKDDKELRDLIKDMIRGQVTSIAREEIKGIVERVTTEKFSDKKLDAERITTDYIQSIVKASLSSYDIKSMARDQIKSLVLEHVDEILKKAGIL